MDTRFGILENVVGRMEKLLEEIKQDIKDLNISFSSSEKENQNLRRDTNSLMADVVAIKTTLYDDRSGILHRMREVETRAEALELWKTNTTEFVEKIFWEAAKPIIGLLVTGVLIGLALLVVFIYSLQFIIQLIP